MVGKTIEIIAFELDEEKSYNNLDNTQNIKRIREITKNNLVDLSNYKFNRNEANNYEE